MQIFCQLFSILLKVFLVLPFFNLSGYKTHILIEAEDRASQQERLRHIVEQPRRHVVDLDHLIRHERDTAHDEQHRTSVLRDLEAFVVFHGVRKS